jgi:hypothetical protein
LPALTLTKDHEAPYLELIAIHGILESNTADAWSTPRYSPAPGASVDINWLTDDHMLPSQLPNFRVWEFQYDVNPLRGRDNALKTHINDNANALRSFIREKLTDTSQLNESSELTEISTRPLLFVTHGYGGLLAIKTVLQPVLSARTIGIVCLGTPFRPVEQNNAIPFALPIPNPERGLLSLSEEFNALPELLQDFRSGKDTNKLPIRCFWETAKSRWNGMDGIVVPNTAAVFDNMNLSFGLDEIDHFSLNKFSSPDDRNFALITDVIGGIVDMAYIWMLTQAITNGEVMYAKRIIDDHSQDFPINDGLSKALKAAVIGGQVDILKLMLDANIRVNAPLTAEKDTALILAVQSKVPQRNEIVQELLQKGADISAKNEDEKSARDFAVEQQDQELLNILGRSFILGPTVNRRLTTKLQNPHLNIDDFESSRQIRAKIVDVYEVQGVERIFLKNPSVYDLIYEHGPNHLMNRARSKETEEGKKKFRWIHLPANNILWTKDLIKRIYKEATQSDGDHEQYYRDKCNNILGRGHWEDVVNTSPLPELSYVRHMLPRCRTFSYARDLDDDTKYADMIFFMPYLHYESTSQRTKMYQTVKQVLQTATKVPLHPEKNTTDDNALWGYLRAKDMPLHIRRTLDQSYYDAVNSDEAPKLIDPNDPDGVDDLKDVKARNEDQVTQRFMEAQPGFKDGDETLMLMVDQLWMVLLEDNILITAFPQRWDTPDYHELNPVREADIANIIAKELGNRNRQPLDSAYDMMMLVLKYCTGVLFDVDAHQNERLRFLTFFERIIQTVVCNVDNLFNCANVTRPIKRQRSSLISRTNSKVYRRTTKPGIVMKL